MIFFHKKSFKYFYFNNFIFFKGCQLQEPTKNHGILFLENRANQLKC